MTKENNTSSESDLEQSNHYLIRVKGRLDPQWADWFDGMVIMPEEDNTTLIIGPVIDDAALHGLLKRVRDSGLRLLSVNQVDPAPVDDDTSGQFDHVQSGQNGKDSSI